MKHTQLLCAALIAAITVVGLGPSRGAASARHDANDGGLSQEPMRLPGRYLAPHDLAIHGKAAGAMRELHDYGPAALVDVDDPNLLSAEALSRLTPLEDPSRVAFRAWTGSADVLDLGDGGDGYYLVAFDGPVDAAWLDEIERLGARVVETAFPYTLVVRGDGAQLERLANVRTTTGGAAVRGIRAVPAEARVEPLLIAAARKQGVDDVRGLRRSEDGRVVVRAIAYPDRDVASVAGQVGIYAEPATGLTGYGYADAFVVSGFEIEAILANVPGVAYVEPLFERELCGNLAAKAGVLDIEPMWSLGWDGSGVSVNHNDNGIDLNGVSAVDPFPTGVVTATAGKMSGTDNAHGTHTAGLVAGRATSENPPTNTEGCTDLTPSLPKVRGMAPGATINSNNLFDPNVSSGTDGMTTENTMMKFAQDNGSQLSTNSWAYVQSYSYNSASATIDRAVRDADTDQTGQQPLAIVFAAGNDGGAGAGTIQSPGNAKNAITVGASHNARCGSFPTPSSTFDTLINSLASFSGRGPSQGRIKPDFVAVGANVLSNASDASQATHPWDQSWTGDHYELMPGTSMATPIAAGAAACFFEFYRTTYGASPSPALVKAALVNGAVNMGGGYQIGAANQSSTGIFAQGWGRLNLRNSIHGPVGGSIHFVDETSLGLATGQSSVFKVQVASSSAPFEISLVWTDPQGSAGSNAPLVNNLDLIVTSPNGVVFRGNRFTGGFSTPNPGTTADTANNVECVFLPNPIVGTWTVEVRSANTAQNVTGKTGQDFALAYSGAVQPGELLTNGGFDTGSFNPWLPSNSLTALTTLGEHAGSHCARILGTGVPVSTTLSQAPAFPRTGKVATLRFFLKIQSGDGGNPQNDRLRIQITNSSGIVLTTLANFGNGDRNAFADWREVVLTIPSTVARQGSRLHFAGSENFIAQTTFFVDTVSIR